MIDYAILDIATTIRRWKQELSVLRQVIDRLSWLLDGWPDVMKTAHDILRDRSGDMANDLRTLQAMLPQTPALDAPPRDHGSERIANVLATKLSIIWSGIAAP